jgi:hypothetical protein
LIGLIFAACSGHGATQPTVVVRASASSLACDDSVVAQDAYDSVMNRARCDHPDMLVHPAAWALRRVPSRIEVKRFALEHDGRVDSTYDVAHDGRARRVNETVP